MDVKVVKHESFFLELNSLNFVTFSPPVGGFYLLLLPFVLMDQFDVFSFVLQEWVDSLAEFLKESFGSVPSSGLFRAHAWEQVLSSDLREMGRCSFSSSSSSFLSGPFLLQIAEWRDAARPLQRRGDGLVEADEELEGADEALPGLRANRTETTSAHQQGEYSGKRVLRLTCDGSETIQGVVAFEYRYCPCLKTENLKKGCKIIVHDCLVMNGMLALTPQSIKWIGGGWEQGNAESQQQQHPPAHPPPPQFDDLVDMEDLETIAAMERAALQSKQTKASAPPSAAAAAAPPPPPTVVKKELAPSSVMKGPPPSVVGPSPPIPALAVKKRPRKRFLDDSD